MTIDARLSYFDFPFCRETFCTGRGATSREEIRDGVIFRRYGRNPPLEYTFMGALQGADVLEVMTQLAREGCRLKSMNFTSAPPAGVPTAKGPPDYRVAADFDTHYAGRSAKTRQTIARACRGITVRSAYMSDKAVAAAIFDGWVDWADTRHFMVFKGHYRRWLEMWFAGQHPASAWLYVLETAEGPAALFGGETEPGSGEAQVTVAKHLPSLSSKALWTLGLRRVQEDWRPSMVHCGSTADTLKLSLGMEPTASWTVDVRAIREATKEQDIGT